MKDEKMDRFDMIMSNLKPIELSAGFDFEFRRKLAEAVARKYAERPLEVFVRRAGYALESLREALVPKTPVLVRAMVAFLFFATAGLYVYSIQPALPLAINVEGVIMVQGTDEAATREMTASGLLKAGDEVTTRSDSQLDINLLNRYTVRVKPETTFKIAKLTPRIGRGALELQLIKGNMLVNVEKGFKGSEFTINTPAGTATALGTMFGVSSFIMDRPKMDVGVLEGAVQVRSGFKPAKALLAERTVIVGAGQMTEVVAGQVPQSPRRLLEGEWRSLEEIYQIGGKPKVVLLIKNTPDRVRQLLAPCPIYISDERPRKMPADVESAVKKIAEAMDSDDISKHLDSIKILQEMIKRNPRAKYNAQLLLYLASYYEYIDHHQDAIKTFEEALRRYPGSQFASIAQCAIGIIYDEQLKDKARADEAFKAVLDNYPNSLEAIWVEKEVSHLKSQ